MRCLIFTFINLILCVCVAVGALGTSPCLRPHPPLPRASCLVPSLPGAEAPGAGPVCRVYEVSPRSFILEHAFSLLITLPASSWAASSAFCYPICSQRCSHHCACT